VSVIRRISVRKAVPIVAAVLIGLFLSIAGHALDWSRVSTFVVGCALVAILGALGTPLILFQRAEGRWVPPSHPWEPAPLVDIVAFGQGSDLWLAATSGDPEVLKNQKLKHPPAEKPRIDRLDNRTEVALAAEANREVRVWNESKSLGERNEIPAMANAPRGIETSLEGFKSRGALALAAARS
jgi:hypothetical protein